MAHQDYSQICPIFKEGVEKELVFPHVNTCCTISIPMLKFQFGREVTVIEAFGHAYTSDTVYLASSSCTIQIFKVGGATSASLSNVIGSIAFGSADRSVTNGCQPASLIASTAASASFTSTDLIGIGMVSFADSGGSSKTDPTIVIRYRDK